MTDQRPKTPVAIPEIIIVPDITDEVICDGGGGALGHPNVWYTFDGKDTAECGYCDRFFVKERSKERVMG